MPRGFRRLPVLAVVVGLALTPCLAGRVDKARRTVSEGLRELDAGRPEQAESRFERAARLDPNAVEAYVQLGHLAMARRDWSHAVARYERAKHAAIHLLSEHADRHYEMLDKRPSLLFNYRDMLNFVRSPRYGGRDRERRIAELEKKIRDLENLEQTPLDTTVTLPAELSFFLGNALYRSERLEEARVQFQAAIAAAESFGPAHANVALVHMQLGDHDAAWHHVEAARAAGVEPAAGFLAELVARSGDDRR